ncbi:MAG: diguanylate cyclase [Roseinatronobacter sp.]
MTHRILVVTDQPLTRITLRTKLAAACYAPLLATSGDAALDLAHIERPDLILLDTRLQDQSGLDFCRAIRADARVTHIPVVLLTDQSDRDSYLEGLRAGAQDVLLKPIDESLLMSRMRALLRANATVAAFDQLSAALRQQIQQQLQAPQNAWSPLRVDMIGDGTGAAMLRPALTPGFSLRTHTPRKVLSPDAGMLLPDAFVLMPSVVKLNGLSIVSDLKSRPTTQDIPIMVILPPDLAAQRGLLLDLGAADVLVAPVLGEEARLRLETLCHGRRRDAALDAALRTELHMAAHDQLTGLFNRRHAQSRLDEMLHPDAMRHGGTVALLLIDLDNFKAVNDIHGYLAGDEVLVEVARRMRQVVRTDDLLARYGGEEFLLALPDVTIEQAHHLAERLRQCIESAPYKLRSGAICLRITASIGVTVQTASSTSRAGADQLELDRLIDAADQGLHVAKANGRNRVSLGYCAVA